MTLVPDAVGQLTSNHGWNTIEHQEYLKTIIAIFKNAGIRVSIFIDPVKEMITAAATTGSDRIELYTESYAKEFEKWNSKMDKTNTILMSYINAAQQAKELGLGINAGHDLDVHNLKLFNQSIPFLDEVSIGHALICDAIYWGFENTIQMYKRQLN